MTNVAIVALMAILSPLASSMFTPGISQIAEDLDTSEQSVIATTTGFVICLGLGPLILAPLSETFGRRPLYICCFAIFSLLQAASALSPNIAALIALRTIAGLFGSVGIANGGGTINDMYLPSQRAGVYGWYLLGPLLGISARPLAPDEDELLTRQTRSYSRSPVWRRHCVEAELALDLLGSCDHHSSGSC